jgi:polysaccharide export outer membrane protein
MRPKFILGLLILLSSYSWSFGQLLSGMNDSDTLISKPAEIPETEPALEEAVDPEEYIVGPGDVISIVLGDEFQTNYSLKVTADGMILIPRINTLFITGKSLEEVKSLVREAVLKKHKNIEVTVSLVNLRRFKVSVTGAVENPGTYSGFANERVSEIIKRAGGGLQNSSARNIILRRKDGSEKRVDILKFLRAGQNDRNPYLLDGDIIWVPFRENLIHTCGIYGAVKEPGEYEYSEGDSLVDLINLAGGLTTDADLSSAEIVRFGPDNKNTQTINKDLTSLFSAGPRGEDIPLLPDDRVFIRAIPDFRKKKQVTLKGEVLRPGVYVINEGETKITDLIELAGGFTQEASLEEAEMNRKYSNEEPDLEYERLKKIPVADMKSYEYEYFKSKSREIQGRVSIDFVKLFEGKDQKYDILLTDGDMVYVPKKSLVVKVLGKVVNPGYLAYEPGKDYLYYINKAGGFSWRADKGKIKLIKVVTGEWVKPDKNLQPGDVIWVPEKPERHTIRDILTATGAVSAVYIAIKAALK